MKILAASALTHHKLAVLDDKTERLNLHFVDVHTKFWSITAQTNNRKNSSVNSRAISSQNSNTIALPVDYFLE